MYPLLFICRASEEPDRIVIYISLKATHKVTLIYVFFSSFWNLYYDYEVPARSAPANLGLLDQIDLSKITLMSVKADNM